MEGLDDLPFMFLQMPTGLVFRPSLDVEVMLDENTENLFGQLQL